MVRFVVFLRAINVGGHVVNKAKLHEAFTSSGYLNVSTFKQSGNVIFETDKENANEIKKKVEAKLRESLGYDVAAFVRTIAQLKAIIDFQAFKSVDKLGSSFLVTFLADAP